MKVINVFEFSEMLQNTPGISKSTFYIHPANILTGDNALTLFFHMDDAGDVYVVEDQLGKSPKLVKIDSPELNTILFFKQGSSTWGEGYFHAAVMRYSAVETLQAVQERYNSLPITEFVKDSLHALQRADWVVVPQLAVSGEAVSRDMLEVVLSRPGNINLSVIKFCHEDETYNVVGKGFREEVMLELIRYDEKLHNAYFSGIVAGKPIYQRVKLEEVSFRGDYDFMQWVKTHNFDNGDAGHGLWWVRHMGVSLHVESNSLTIKNPHLSVRGIVKNIPDSYDTINNRTVIL